MKHIDPQDLKTKLETNQAIIVDVREPAEFRTEHILGSHSIPLREVSLSKLPANSKTIVFLCRSGRRSSDVCNKFIMEHPELAVYSLSGGINAWKEAGYDVERGAHGIISLERQIQLAAGTLVLVGIVVGAFINRGFYLLSAFVGCGLMFAGLTGWCGMGKLLARMPWNK